MNAPLATLQAPPDSTVNASSVGNKILTKQQDTASPGGFGSLLDEAQAALPSQPAGDTALPADVEDLALQLQSLPHGGKLLPLLQQVLGSAEQAGVDTQQLVDGIAARLEQLQADGEPNPTEAISEVLQQLLVAIPDSQMVAVSQAVLPAVVDSKALKPGGTSSGQPDRAQLPPPDGRLPVTGPDDRKLPEETRAEIKSTGLDRPLMPVQQQDSGPRNTELASLIAAFKRSGPETSRASDTLLRPDVAAGAATTQTAVQPSPSTPSGMPSITLGTPLNQNGWDQALGERVQWMVNQNLQGARIKLNPAHLGPMEVRIQVQNEQASIHFSSAHGVVREALEAALPRLRDMFDSSGIELVDVDVSGQSFAGQQGAAGESEATAWRGGNNATQDAGPETVLETSLGHFMESGRLDLFA